MISQKPCAPTIRKSVLISCFRFAIANELFRLYKGSRQRKAAKRTEGFLSLHRVVTAVKKRILKSCCSHSRADIAWAAHPREQFISFSWRDLTLKWPGSSLLVIEYPSGFGSGCFVAKDWSKSNMSSGQGSFARFSIIRVIAMAMLESGDTQKRRITWHTNSKSTEQRFSFSSSNANNTPVI